MPLAQKLAPPPLAALEATSPSNGSNRQLLARSEALLRQLLRRRRRLLALPLTQIARACATFDAASLKASGGADLVAFVLASMHWCGFSHPAFLLARPLHPPTGVVRWLAGFKPEDQIERASRLLERLAKEELRIFEFAQALVARMSGVRARPERGVVLLPELLRAAERADLQHKGTITTQTDEESMS